MEHEERVFELSVPKGPKWVPVCGVGSVLCLGAISVLYLGPMLGVAAFGMILLTGLFMIGVIRFLSSRFRPRCYRVGDSGVTIHRANERVHVGVSRLLSVEPSPVENFLWKTCGVDTGDCCWGSFWCKKLGHFEAYTTRKTRLVLLRVAGRNPILLSPDDPEEFIEAVQQVMDRHKSDCARNGKGPH